MYMVFYIAAFLYCMTVHVRRIMYIEFIDECSISRFVKYFHKVFCNNASSNLLQQDAMLSQR